MSVVPETFDRETLLDPVVTAVPPGVLAAFTLPFVAVAPYGFDPVATTVQFALVLAPLAALVVLSYYAALAVERDESAVASTPAAFAEPGAAPADALGVTVGDGAGNENEGAAGDGTADADRTGATGPAGP